MTCESIQFDKYYRKHYQNDSLKKSGTSLIIILLFYLVYLFGLISDT